MRLKALHIALAALFLLLIARPSAADQRLIQDQGSSPYCLFAANAYLLGVDMWQLEAIYHRRNLPTWPGTVIPKNPDILNLATELYGTQWIVHPYNDFAAAKEGVRTGHSTVFTGNGHAIVVTGWQNETVTYVDSLHPETPLTQSEAQLKAWWDGWAWHIK